MIGTTLVRRCRAALLAAAVVAGGCSALSGPASVEPPAAPAACAAVYPADRCQAMVDQAAVNLGVLPGAVVAIAIEPEPTPKVVDGMTMLDTLGGARSIVVVVSLADGTAKQTRMCGGIPSGPACSDRPQLIAAGIERGSGYRDVPCPGDGDPPKGCATPLPTLDPAAVAAARPIRVGAVDVPVDRVGAYEVVAGTGSLANGILTRATFSLADDWPHDLGVAEGWISLEVRSTEADGTAFRNYYDHGWRPGVERVEAVLRFVVIRYEPGAVLRVRDVVVR